MPPAASKVTAKQRIPSFADENVTDLTRKKLQNLVAPHVESFNYFLSTGLNDAISDIPTCEVKISDSLSVKMHFVEAQVAYPTKSDYMTNCKLTPREAREREMSYSGTMIISAKIELSDGNEFNVLFRCSDLPIMVMSDKCHLRGLGPHELVKLREEANEVGGYFIVNGIERVIRLLQVPRRNHAFAIERSSFKKRGPAYSSLGKPMLSC